MGLTSGGIQSNSAESRGGIGDAFYSLACGEDLDSAMLHPGYGLLFDGHLLITKKYLLWSSDPACFSARRNPPASSSGATSVGQLQLLALLFSR